MPKIIRRTVSRTRLIPHAVVIQPTPVVSVIKEEVLVSSDGQIHHPAQIVETILPVVVSDGQIHHPAQIVETIQPVVVVEQQERLVKLV